MKLPHLTFGKVLAGTTIVLIATSGTAYAAATITGADIVNGTVESIDIKNETILGADILNGTIKGADIGDSSVASVDILNGSIAGLDILDGTIKSADVGNNSLTSADILDGTIKSADVADNSLTSADILDNSLTAGDLAPNSVSSSEVVDFGLSNEDIGVLFVQVNATGLLANSSGANINVLHDLTGVYVVDFARNVASCAFVAAPGSAGPVDTLPPPAFTAVSDAENDPHQVVVNVTNLDGNPVDAAFQLIAVC